MLTIIGTVIGGFISLGLVYVGIRFLTAPRASAAGYGVPVTTGTSSDAYLSVKGARDLGFALMLGIATIAASPTVLGLLLIAGGLVAFSDCLIVLRHNGPKVLAYAMHGGTGVLALVGGILLLLA